MKKQRNHICSRNRSQNNLKINKEKIENSQFNNTLSPMQNKNTLDNINNLEDNYNNLSNNENNVIANILETNKIKKDSNKKDDFKKTMENNNYKSKENFIIYNEYNQIGNFNFITISKIVKPFKYQPQQTKEYSSFAFNNFKFLDISNSYKMIINILVDDDSFKSSKNLADIFNLIVLSLDSLNEIKISNKDFLVCIFFQHFSFEQTFKHLFPGLSFYNTNNWNNYFYCSYGQVISVNDTPISTLIFYKESSTFVEIYKFFYCYILNDLMTLVNIDSKEIGKTFLLVNWPNGKIYQSTSNKYHKSRILSNIIRISNNRNIILIPDINYCPYNNEDHFGYVNKYNLDTDKVEVNLFWEVICGYPIDHRFFFINMNYKLYILLKRYYQNDYISIYANEYYHDYNLVIYLKDNKKNIVIKKIQQVKIQYSDLPYSLVDLFYDYILRKGCQYANCFKLIPYFFSCKNITFFKFIQKFFLFFKLLSCIMQFFWLGISFLITYAVFNDTFGSRGNNMDYFCSLGYVMIVILLLFISLLYVKNKPKIKKNIIHRNFKRNSESLVIIKVLHFIHYLYFFFFIISALVALIHIKQGKNHEITDCDYYVFNTNLYIIILIVNILLYVLPSFLRPANLISKGFLYYLLFVFPNLICFFQLPYIFTCIRNINSKSKKMESIYISLYVILNGLLTVICLVFDTKRQRRMDFLTIIAIIYTVLNGINLIICIIGFCMFNRFNKNISTGDIPQYNVSSEECDKCNLNNKINNNICINNNIKTININLRDNKNNNNNFNFNNNINFYNHNNFSNNNISNNNNYNYNNNDINKNNYNNNNIINNNQIIDFNKKL